MIRSFGMRSGAVIQHTVRSYATEAKAQADCKLRQAEFDGILGGLIVIQMPDGSGRSTGVTVQQLLEDLGFTAVGHKVMWTEASDVDLVSPLLVVPGKH